ncbi:MAG: cupin domain-containing protein [Eubacterium sp.]
MLIKNKEHQIDEKFEMRGGSGTIHIKHVADENILCDKGRLYAQITVEPGCSIGIHEHINEKEIFYVLKGQAEAEDNGKTVILEPGDVLVTGNGSTHAVKNRGSENLEMMALILYGDECYE